MTRDVPDVVLDAYARTAKEYGPGQAEATALRANSVAMRDVLVYAASDGRLLRYSDLLDDSAVVDTLQPRWSAALARTIALQAPSEPEEDLARRLLSASVPLLPKTASTFKYRVLQVELLLDALRFEDARRVLAHDEELARLHHGYLTTDLYNPFAGSPFGAYDEWLPRFNQPFRDGGLDTVEVRAGNGVPFDGLISSMPGGRVNGPLTSVIITTFRPERNALHTAVRSVLDQSWRNLDIIVVDDASPAKYDSILEEISSLDERIRLAKQEVNGGTYLARNTGIKMARGELITCQDSDDYSHRRRIEWQAGPLLADPSVAGSRSYCIAVQENLSLHRRGYWPMRPNASSLMFRTDTARRLGGFLKTRKAADSEFHARLERYVGRPVVDIKSPLALVRILADSLSRSDFRGGWHHDSRRSFRTAYEAWHRSPRTKQFEIADGAAPPIRVPDRLAVTQRPKSPLDFTFVGDWRSSAAKQVVHLEQMRELARAGKSVGVLHLDSAWFLHGRMADVSAHLQEAISTGEIERVLFDEHREVGTLVVVDPTVMQFPPRHPTSLAVSRSVLLLDEMLVFDQASTPCFDVESCRLATEEVFGKHCQVVTAGLGRALNRGSGTTSTYSLLLPIDSLASDRRTPASVRAPTLGFELPIEREQEKATRGVIRKLYAQAGAFDVRVIGARQPNVFRRGRAFPANTVYFAYEDIDFRTFLSSVDFFVITPGAPLSSEALGLCVSSGAIALSLLPHDSHLDNLVFHCRANHLLDTVNVLWSDPAAQANARATALETLRRQMSKVESLFDEGRHVRDPATRPHRL